MSTNGPSYHGGIGERLMHIVWRRPTDAIAERTRRRVVIHLIPFLFFLYILAYLDRINVSVAALAMRAAPDHGGMGFDDLTIGVGAGLFFWGYWILEIPSTVSVVRWGARVVFVRILILWGLCAALVGLIGTPFVSTLFAWLPLVRDNPKYQFYFLRFMLGFFEGGFFPSVIVYLSFWFRAEDRAKAIAGFMSAIPLSGVLGMWSSGLMLDFQWLGLAGWRWIFILEGLAPVLAGFATIFFLPDRPTTARWLPPDERAWLTAELDREHQSKQGHGHLAWRHHLGMVLLLTAVYFCLNVSSYGLSMFMPSIIKSQLPVSNKVATLLTSLAYGLAFIAMLINGGHSDRSGERIWHVAVPLTLLSIGILLSSVFAAVPILPAVLMIVWVGTFWYAHLPAFWPIPSSFLGATVAAAAIGFINMIGNLGGSVGPTVVGWLTARQNQAVVCEAVATLAWSSPGGAPSSAPWAALHQASHPVNFSLALLAVAPWPFVGAAIILIVGYARRKVLTGSPAPLDQPLHAAATAGEQLPSAPVTD